MATIKEGAPMYQLFGAIKKAKSSDLHLSAGAPPKMRVDGDMTNLSNTILDDEATKTLIYSAMSKEQIEVFERDYEYDFCFDVEGVARFRANIFKQNRGIGAVYRMIPTEILSLEKLNSPEILKTLCDIEKGIILVTGPTGSGKSTTLAAMINHINHNQAKHILTIEDPIEFVHKSDKCLINQREVHVHTKGFNEALRSALREDPNIILVGEMRDLETIKLALTAAETGHLVFGTLHTSSAPKTIDRLVDVFPGGEKDMVRAMVSESLKAVVSQDLYKKRGGGRVVGMEIMISTPAIKNLIRENKIAQMYSMMQTGRSLGMQTMEQAVKALIAQQLVDPSLLDAFKAKNKEDEEEN